ncbi:replicative DNA helicase [Actinacidiphila glaucinigra]|uniref:replicative DNA helicase n=1 Tax=Actinacidiphila glaucinigra TaxID=235986 RepID=UPI0035DBA926
MTVTPMTAKSTPRRREDRHGDGDGAPSPSFERVPPQNLEAEQSVLGGMLLSKDAIVDVQGVAWPEDYYRPAHATIHRTIMDLYGRGEPADPITVTAELTKTGDLARAGGSSYLHDLVTAVPTAANAEWYAEIVHECAVLRRLIEAGTRIVQDGYAGSGDVDALVARAAAAIAEVVEGRDREDDFVLPQQSLPITLDLVDQAHNGRGMTGVSTGFADLDSLTQGLQPGQMVVIAGRPGMGKSTLAMDMLRACAVRDGRPAAFVSLEMGLDELNMRLLSAEGRIGLHHIRSGTMTEDDWTRMAAASGKLTHAPLYVTESATTLPEIQSKLRRLKARQPDLALVAIDYMQLITLGGRRPDVREQEVSEISRALKLLAKELQVPILALAQLNRGPEMRADKRPVASDLRESGSQEQDADIIILLHRPDAYEIESPRAGEADLIVAKHRNGPTATITTAFQGHYSRFVDMATG